MRYKIEEYPPHKTGKWGGNKVSSADAEGQQGTLYPTGKSGKGIEIKEDANKHIDKINPDGSLKSDI